MKTKVSVPKCITDKLAALDALCERYPLAIPLPDAADFLGCKEDGLRAAIFNGTCPFGVGWKIGSTRGFKIPTVQFYLWLTNNALYRQEGK